MLILVKFFIRIPNGHVIESLFITTYAELNEAYEVDMYFDEVAGFSGVEIHLDSSMFTVLSEDQAFVNQFKATCGNGCGYNPLEFIEDFASSN